MKVPSYGGGKKSSYEGKCGDMTRVAVQPPTEAGGGLFLSKVKSNNEGLKRRATEAPRAAPGKEKHQNPEASPTV